MKKIGLNWWCDRAWIKFLCIIASLMTGLILMNWNTWSTELKIIAAIAVLIPLHVLEEWVFPGGFHYQYNSFFGSALPERYPMCRLTDMITNLAGTILYIILTVLCIIRDEVSTGMILGTIIFCCLELIVHTVFGIFMYVKLKAKGKTTIYGPGSITAYWGFTVFGVILLYCMKGRTILSYDWIEAGIILLIIAVGCILLPENLLKKKDTQYYFENNGYYDRFL